MMSHLEKLRRKDRDRQANVGVVGLGYVGLPLAVEFAQAGFTSPASMIGSRRWTRSTAGESYIQDIPDEGR